jgi:hypothetical protein
MTTARRNYKVSTERYVSNKIEKCSRKEQAKDVVMEVAAAEQYCW